MKINVIDQNLKTIADIEIKLPANFKPLDSSLVRYVKVFLNNQHQWTSSTKTRAEVRGGGKKPWNQKGTGRARAGSNRSPIWVGGGSAHGPRPRSIPDAIGKKVSRQAFVTALLSLLNNNAVLGVELELKEKPITKVAKKITQYVNTDKSILFIHNGDTNAYLSFRNIKNIQVKDVANVNAYDLTLAKKVLIQSSSVDKLNERIK